MTITLFSFLAFYFLVMYFDVLDKEGTDLINLFILCTLVFGSFIIMIIVLIIKYCYEYWILLDDSLVSKKLFSKRKEIKLSEINKVEKKIVPAIVFEIYKSEAYVIYSKNIKIVILINDQFNKRKSYQELGSLLSKYIEQ